MPEKISWSGEDEMPDEIKADEVDDVPVNSILFNPRTNESFLVKKKMSGESVLISRLRKKWYLRLWNWIRHFWGYKEQIDLRTEDVLELIPIIKCKMGRSAIVEVDEKGNLAFR